MAKLSLSPRTQSRAKKHQLMGGGGSPRPRIRWTSRNTPSRKSRRRSMTQNWGTYVTVHSYSAKAIQNAIRGGVRNVEHGQMIDEETAQLMKETNTSICLQPFYDDEDAIRSCRLVSGRKVPGHDLGTDTAYALRRNTTCSSDSALTVRACPRSPRVRGRSWRSSPAISDPGKC